MKRLLIISLAIAILPSAAFAAQDCKGIYSKMENLIKNEQLCETDDDCTYVYYGNCEGFEYINKEYEQEIKKLTRSYIKNCTKNGFCPPPSVPPPAVCVNKSCVMQGDKSKKRTDGWKVISPPPPPPIQHDWNIYPSDWRALDRQTHLFPMRVSRGAPTALYWATYTGNFAKVEAILEESKKDINTKIEGGYAPLHIAILYGHKKITELLISAGAYLDKRHPSALHMAIKLNQLEIAKTLINAGANPNNLEIVYLAIEHPDIWDTLDFSKIDLEYKLRRNTILQEMILAGNVRAIKLLLNADASLKGEYEYEDSALWWAILTDKLSHEKSYEIIEIFTNYDLDVNVKDWRGRTPLSDVTKQKNYDVARLLISHGADVSTLDQNESSVLMLAVKDGNMKIIDFLINKGAKISYQQKVVLTRLKRHQLHTALATAIIEGHKDVVKLLLKNNVDLSTIGGYGNTYLHLCALYNRPNILRLLLKKESIDYKSLNDLKQTALLIAQEKGSKEIIALLDNDKTD